MTTLSSIPTEEHPWNLDLRHSIVSAEGNHRLKRRLRQTLENTPWHWPKRPVIFLTDPHADPDALLHSLEASGGIKRPNPRKQRLKLTRLGRKADFIIGGDCFEKGPSNLGILRIIKQLIDLNARVKILAGNHDVRIILGMLSTGHNADPLSDHLFIRMGNKVFPFLVELRDHYAKGKRWLKKVPDEKRCRALLYPHEKWEQQFIQHGGKLLDESAVQKEIKQFHSRKRRFEQARIEHDLNYREIYAISKIWHKQFFKPNGEFHWYIRKLRMAHRTGSLLFLHAGINDQIAQLVATKGEKHLNRTFRKLLEKQPFDLYFGPIGGVLRTKYRRHEWKLSELGAEQLKKNGITTLVHGHRNLYHGQRLVLRAGLLNIECDCTMDRLSRKREELHGCGVSATVIQPQGVVRGISSDSPYIKVFNPNILLSQLQK